MKIFLFLLFLFLDFKFIFAPQSYQTYTTEQTHVDTQKQISTFSTGSKYKVENNIVIKNQSDENKVSVNQNTKEIKIIKEKYLDKDINALLSISFSNLSIVQKRTNEFNKKNELKILLLDTSDTMQNIQDSLESYSKKKEKVFYKLYLFLFGPDKKFIQQLNLYDTKLSNFSKDLQVYRFKSQFIMEKNICTSVHNVLEDEREVINSFRKKVDKKGIILLIIDFFKIKFYLFLKKLERLFNF